VRDWRRVIGRLNMNDSGGSTTLRQSVAGIRSSKIC
jgi:hypothetical protein